MITVMFMFDERKQYLVAESRDIFLFDETNQLRAREILLVNGGRCAGCAAKSSLVVSLAYCKGYGSNNSETLTAQSYKECT